MEIYNDSKNSLILKSSDSRLYYYDKILKELYEVEEIKETGVFQAI